MGGLPKTQAYLQPGGALGNPWPAQDASGPDSCARWHGLRRAEVAEGASLGAGGPAVRAPGQGFLPRRLREPCANSEGII